MTDVDPRIEHILVKLARVRARTIETFGAGTHRYLLAPPLTEPAVRALEVAHRIELPAAGRRGDARGRGRAPRRTPARLDALRAMHQLPSVQPATGAIIVACISDVDAAVRIAALQLVKAHRLVERAEAAVRTALEDADAIVRATALDAPAAARPARR